MTRLLLLASWVWLLTVPLLLPAATPQSTAFTFQGNLSASGAPANGNVDLTFKLFDSVTGSNQVGPTLTMLQFPVVNGVFTTDLDFGAVFNGTQLWLEVTVNGQTLTPRQAVNAVPVAQFALSGITGAPGTNGHNGLVAQNPEPSGANCTGGGVRITSGVDTNNNNVLDANEVTATSYVCNLTNATTTPPAGCSSPQPLSWQPTAVTYIATDPQPGTWPGINTGASVQLAPHVNDPNSCGAYPVTPITYTWALVAAPAGSHASLFPANGTNPVLVPDVPGTYQVAVTAADAIGAASPIALSSFTTSTCGVNPVNVATLVTPDSVTRGLYQLGSAVSTSDNDASQCPGRFATSFTYAWSVIGAPLSAQWQFSSPTLAGTSFQSSDAGAFLVQLLVHDSNGQTGSTSASINIPAAGYSTGFEACPGGWTLTGDWQCGIPQNVGPATAFEGTQCLGTQIAANYNNNQTWAGTTATSPDINLSGLTNPTATFRMWVDTEGGASDGANLQISTDGGATYTVVTGVSPAYTLAIGGEPAWGGHQAALGWQPVSADLSPYVGSTVRLRFGFQSDSAGTYPGFYVDSFSVQ